MDVRLPDGTVIQNVPEDTTRAELIEKLRANGYDVSKFESPTAPEQSSPTAQQSGQSPSSESASPTVPETTGQRGGALTDSAPDPPDSQERTWPEYLGGLAEAGARSVAQGATFNTMDEIQAGISALPIYAMKNLFTDDKVSLGEAYGGALDITRRGYEELEEDYPVTTFAGEMGVSLGTGIGAAGMLKAVKPGAYNALRQFAMSRPGTSSAATAAGTGFLYGAGDEGSAGERLQQGAFTGGVSAPLGFVGGKLAQRFSMPQSGRKTAQAADDLGMTDDAHRAFSAMSPEEQANSIAMQRVGIPVEGQTGAMVTRDPRLYQFEQSTRKLQGLGDDINVRYLDANQRIQEALQDVGIKTGGKASTQTQAGDDIARALKSKADEMQDEINKLYGQIRDEYGDRIGLRPSTLRDVIEETDTEALAADWRGREALLRNMRKLDVIDKDNNVTGELTVSKAEDLRKFINRMSDKNDPSIGRLKSLYIDALDEDVIETTGDDFFREARSKAAKKIKEFNKRELVGKVQQGKIDIDDVVRKTVFNGSLKDLRALKSSLLSGTDEQVTRGTQAWDSLRGQVVDNLMEQSLDGTHTKISGAKFRRAFNKISEEKLDELFDADELLQLRAVDKALELTDMQVPGAFVNYSNTSSDLLNNIIKQTPIADSVKKYVGSVVSVPIFGPTASIGAAGAKGLVNRATMKATEQSVKRTTDITRNLRKLANPGVVGGVGTTSGVAGSEITD